MISGLSFAKNKSSETAAKTTTSVKYILINQLQIDPDNLNMELDKIHRLPLDSTESKKQPRKRLSNVIYRLKIHCFREKLHAKRKMIYEKSKQTINFHVSLTKERSTLLEKAQNRIYGIRGVKFCFANPNSNLKVKFDDNKNISFDSIQSLSQSV